MSLRSMPTTIGDRQEVRADLDQAERLGVMLHALAERRIVDQHLDDWRTAFKGSTFERAQEMDHIYEQGAPIASTVMSKIAADFVQEMRTLVHRAIIGGGGRLEAQIGIVESAGASTAARAARQHVGFRP